MTCVMCRRRPAVLLDALDIAWCQTCLDARDVPCRAQCEDRGGCDWDNPREPCPQTRPDYAALPDPPELVAATAAKARPQTSSNDPEET